MKKVIFTLAAVAVLSFTMTSCNWNTNTEATEENIEDTITVEEETISEDTVMWVDTVVAEQETDTIAE